MAFLFWGMDGSPDVFWPRADILSGSVESRCIPVHPGVSRCIPVHPGSVDGAFFGGRLGRGRISRQLLPCPGRAAGERDDGELRQVGERRRAELARAEGLLRVEVRPHLEHDRLRRQHRARERVARRLRARPHDTRRLPGQPLTRRGGRWGARDAGDPPPPPTGSASTASPRACFARDAFRRPVSSRQRA